METLTKPTQAQRILAALQAAPDGLTNIQIINMRILRGAARINELRQAGHEIHGTTEKHGVYRYILVPPRPDTQTSLFGGVL